ncbi:MAG: hypothetical protein GJ680_01695, partial [Alteromonadaceae bacterium]|nr:hypothetical protein [Alteromonadaceae bacterium]
MELTRITKLVKRHSPLLLSLSLVHSTSQAAQAPIENAAVKVSLAQLTETNEINILEKERLVSEILSSPLPRLEYITGKVLSKAWGTGSQNLGFGSASTRIDLVSTCSASFCPDFTPRNSPSDCSGGNSAPTSIALTTTSISDSSTGTDATVATASSTDANGSDSHTYSLVSNGASGNGSCGASGDDNNSSFNFSGSTLRTASSLSAGTYNICIQTNDGQDTFQKTFAITVNGTADATIATGSGVSEPVALPTTLNGSGNAVNVYDFTVTNPSSSGGSFRMDNITLNLSGSASGNFSKLRFSIDNCGGAGTAVSDVTGGSTVTFTGANATVGDNSSVTCTVSAYWNDNTGITDNQTVAISMDANDDITVSNQVSNGGFSAVNALTSGDMSTTVTATALAFTTQPSDPVSGIALSTQPVVTAQDAAGNTDADYTSTVTLTENGSGALSDGDATVSIAASSGVATFSGVLYTSNTDADANFTITASDSSITDATSNSINPDVVATQLVFYAEPAPTSITSGQNTDFTTDPVIQAQNAAGQLDTGYTSNVTLSVVDAGGTSLTGGHTVNSFSSAADPDGGAETDVTQTASGGIATFSGLALQYTLSGASDTIDIRATDGGGSLTAANSTTITATVNNTPTISVDGNPTYNETGAVTLDGSVTIADGDGESDLQDGYISFAITGNNTANDTLTMVQSGSLSLSGDNVQISSTTVGTLSASNGGVVSNNTALQINFNSNITAAHAQTIAQAIQFDTTGDSPGSDRTVTFTINDGIADGTDTATVTISSLTADSTNAADFNTTTGAGLTTGLIFDGSDETLTISDATHISGSSTAVANGADGTDTIVIAASVSADLTDANLTLSNFENLTLNDGATVTLTEEQHDTFSANAIAGGAATESIILDTPGGTTSGALTGDADIESYTLNGAFTYTLPSGATTQNVTGSDAASQTINIGSQTLVSGAALDGGSGQTDELQMGTGASISSATTITGFETADITGSVTMTEAQHDSFTSGITASGGSDQITLSSADGDAAFSSDADVETYVLGAALSVTLGTDAGHLAQNITVSGTNDDTITLGSGSYTGTLNPNAGTDTLSLVNGSNVSGATTSNFENLTLANDASVTIAASQLLDFDGTITAAGTETINVNGDGDITINSTLIESYVINDDSTNTRTITVAVDTSTTVSATTSNDAITFNVGTQNYSGTLTGESSTADTVQMGNGSSITSATISNFTNLTLDSGASVTMTEAQHDGFTGTVTASGTEQITISAATDGFTANGDVETYVLGAANSVTLGTTGGSLSQTITGSSGNDTITLGAASYTGALNGNGGTGDTLSVVDSTNVSGATLSNIENLTLASGATLTLAASDVADFTGTITAPGSETLTISGDGDFSTLNSAAIEAYSVNDDSTNTRTITLGANDTATNVSATSTTDAVTFSVPGITCTGTLQGQTTTGDILLLADSANVSGATLTNIGSLSLATGASVTVSAAQYNTLNDATIVAAGTGTDGETITINGDGDVTVNSTTVETYVIQDDSTNSRTVTVQSANSNTFTASSTTDAMTLDIGSNDFSGSFTANTTVANTLSASGTVDIASATLSGFTNLTLSGGTNDITLTSAQLDAFNGTITASGTDTVTFSATGSVTGGNLTAIETFATGTGGSITVTMSATDVNGKTLTATTPASDSFTISGADDAQTINGSAGGDTLSGGNGADTINPGAGTDSMTGGDGNDIFSGSASDLNGDTITDLAEGDTVKLTGVNSLTTSNVRFNGSGTLQIDTDNTTFAVPEVALTLSNSAGDDLNILAVTDNGSDTDITFEKSNNPASFSNLSASTPVAYTENAAAITLDSDVTVFDTELNANSDNYSGSTLTISRNGGASANDVFSADSTSQLSSLDAGTLTFNGTSYGTVANASGTLTLTFNANAPSAATLASIMQAIQYSNSSEAPASSVTLDWVFNDGVVNSTVTTSTQTVVDITAVNDAPVLDAAQSPSLSAIDEDAGDDDSDAADNDDDGSNNSNNPGTDVGTMVVDSSITDADGSAVEAIAVVTVDNTNGVWQYSTDNGTTWIDFSATTGQSVSIASSARLLDGTLSGAATQKVRFVPSQNYNGTATITFRAWDKSTGSAGGTADTSTNGDTTPYSSVSDTASVTITAVNDAPVVSTNSGVTVERGSSIVIPSSALTTSDTEDGASNITYTVTQIPTLGALQKSDGSSFSNMSVNDTFTQEDINNSLVQYVHAGAVNTADSFTFSVSDSNSSQLTGQTFSITISDTTSPTVSSVTIPNNAHKVGDTVTATITVTSDSDNYTTNSGGISGTIGGYSLGGLSKVSDTQYTATFTITDNGTDVAAGSDVPVSIVLTDSTGNSASAFTTAISQASDAIYANLPEVVLSVDQSTIAEDAGVATITASLTGSLNNMWPDDVGIDLSFGGTATNTSDYTRSASSLTISSETLSDTMTITSVADSIYDALANETVIVDINCIVTSSASAASSQLQTITITDAESAPTVTLSVDNTTLTENVSTPATSTLT